MTDYLIPVHDVQVTIRTKGRRVRRIRLIVAGIDVKATSVSDGYRFTIPVIHAHEVCVIEFDKPWATEPEKVVADDDLQAMINCPRAEVPCVVRTSEKRSDDGWNGDGAWAVVGKK